MDSYLIITCLVLFFFVKQKTAYEMRISDWSSDVCSSDLEKAGADQRHHERMRRCRLLKETDPLAREEHAHKARDAGIDVDDGATRKIQRAHAENEPVAGPDHVGDRRVDEGEPDRGEEDHRREFHPLDQRSHNQRGGDRGKGHLERDEGRSEEHTYELQSLMRN